MKHILKSEPVFRFFFHDRPDPSKIELVIYDDKKDIVFRKKYNIVDKNEVLNES